MAKKKNYLGLMLDCSRNAVMSVEGLKSFIPLLKKMGYNALFLYTEDTYELEGYDYFGYMRGRYSEEEIMEIDEYAAGYGIELIPCIQTLAHLHATVRWGKLPMDCNDILLVDDERTYKFIEAMFKTVTKCFKTKKVHIGMDEAWMLGRGQHTNIYGFEMSGSIVKRHLERVRSIAKKYGCELLLWSDMFLRDWNNGMYYMKEFKEAPEEAKNSIPEDITPVYWDYYHLEESFYDNMIKVHRQLSKNLWFAPGAWTWNGFVPNNRFALRTSLNGVRACRKNGVKNFMMTMWGDDGNECSRYATLPTLLYFAEYVRGNEDDEKIKAKFKRIVGIDYDDYMKIDLPNLVSEKTDTAPEYENVVPVNPCKYMTYSDYFNGFLDITVTHGVGEKYARYAEELKEVAKKSRKYGYLFNSAAKLCELLAIKYELGLKTREAYKSGDKDTLRALASYDYPETAKRLNAFCLAFEKQWYKENKPCGFDVQHLRLGGIIRRTEACRKRILEYLDGEVASIPELEEELLPYGRQKGEPVSLSASKHIMSTNLISMALF